MKYRLTAEIQPGSAFGVPEEGLTVIPAGAGECHGPTLHVRAGVIAGHGTLSEYRAEDEALRVSVAAKDARIRFRDNYATVEVDAESWKAALQSATQALEGVLQHLTVSREQLFFYRWLVFEDADQNLYPLPRAFELGSFASYDLDKLRAEIEESASFGAITDDTLKRAMGYYHHALFLFQSRMRLVEAWSPHHQYIISSAFLNCWKAVTVILGDPAVPKEGYQRKYRELGFPREFKVRLDELKRLRDDYDIAHHARTDRLEEVEQNFGRVSRTAAEVIDKHRESLARP